MTYYMIQNFVTGMLEFATTEEEATKIFFENKQTWIDQESYRFTVARVIVNGNDTVWAAASPDTDPEESFYYVFNTFTGQHEEIWSKSQALLRSEQLKNDFVAQHYPQSWQIITEAQYNQLASHPSHGIPLTEL